MFMFLVFFVLLFFLVGFEGGIFMIESNFNWFLVFLSFNSLLLVKMISSDSLVILMVFFLLIFSMVFFFVENLFFFFIFFELSSFPVIFLSLIFGVQVEKINSIFFILFYSFFFGYFFLGLLLLSFIFGENFFLVYFTQSLNWWFMLGLMMVFLVKFPLFFFHFWLPKMHVEAPTLGSVVLAGVLLKFGIHGVSRLLGFLIDLEFFFLWISGFLGVIVSISVCLMQSDMKSLVAFSSIFHSNFILLIFLISLSEGKEVSLMMMIGHGWISSLSFLFVGEIFHGISTRLIYFSTGFFLMNFNIMIFFSVIFLMNAGLPLTLSFFIEFLGSLGLFEFFLVFFNLFFLVLFWGFYFNIFFLVNLMIGKNFFKMKNFLKECFFFVLMNFSFFLFF